MVPHGNVHKAVPGQKKGSTHRGGATTKNLPGKMLITGGEPMPKPNTPQLNEPKGNSKDLNGIVVTTFDAAASFAAHNENEPLTSGKTGAPRHKKSKLQPKKQKTRGESDGVHVTVLVDKPKRKFNLHKLAPKLRGDGEKYFGALRQSESDQGGIQEPCWFAIALSFAFMFTPPGLCLLVWPTSHAIAADNLHSKGQIQWGNLRSVKASQALKVTWILQILTWILAGCIALLVLYVAF